MAADTPQIDELVEHNREYAASFTDAGLPGAPARRLAVVACMDARLDVTAALGLRNGEAHVIRNAGGVITDDVIRSLCLSQRALGTREILLVHHTQCGVQGLDEERLRAELATEVGEAPAWSFESFDDPYDDVRRSIERLRTSPFLLHTDAIAGFVYDVNDGLLHEVAPSD